MLSENQQILLRETLEDNIYLTSQEFIPYVRDTFSVDYSLSGMRDLLHHLGYEYKNLNWYPVTQTEKRKNSLWRIIRILWIINPPMRRLCLLMLLIKEFSLACIHFFRGIGQYQRKINFFT